MAEQGPQEFSTILGPDATFKGELSFDKGMRLQGRLEGKVTTPGRLHVAREAKMQADVEAGAIIVEGDIKGNLNATDRIELKQSARYEGDLRASKLVVDEGAAFSGHVSVGPEAIKNKPQSSGAPSQSSNASAGGPPPRVVPPATQQSQPVK